MEMVIMILITLTVNKRIRGTLIKNLYIEQIRDISNYG